MRSTTLGPRRVHEPVQRHHHPVVVPLLTRPTSSRQVTSKRRWRQAAEQTPRVTTVALPHRAGDRLQVVACWARAAPMSKAARALLAHLKASL
jgi:hypothetical protein